MSKSYAQTHEWVEEKQEGVYLVGISNHAQELLGDIVFVELPAVGDSFNKGDELGIVESVKAASNIYSPVSGEVVEVNEDLESSPELINSSAESDGWLCVIKVSDPSELSSLSNEAEYLASLDS